VTADEARRMWRDLVDAYGGEITLRRVSPLINATVRARATGFEPEELVGGISQGQRKVIILAEDVEAAEFPTPIRARSSDRVIVNGEIMMIDVVDKDTARLGDVQLAYIITATGG
jgi:hypothetical protein